MKRYRTRTWLRQYLPIVGSYIEKGWGNCGDHEWAFSKDRGAYSCLHCRAVLAHFTGEWKIWELFCGRREWHIAPIEEVEKL